jgi:IS30 family transposase
MECLVISQGFHRGFTAAEKTKLWDRWQRGESLKAIERPAAVEDRAVPGHWEGDLLSGSKNSYIATLVEHHTRYVILMKIASKDT